MDFREFATNYLNPVYLMYRVVILITAFAIFFFSIAKLTNGVSASETSVIFVISIVLSILLYSFFKRKPYLLYLVIPFILVGIGLSMIGSNVSSSVLTFPMALCWTSSILLAFNGFRSWGYGVSMNDINDKLNDN